MPYSKPDSPWYEIEGLRGEDWFPLYHAASKHEAVLYLQWALEQTDPIHDRYEDFRIAPPTVVVDRRGRATYEKPRSRRRAA